MMAFHFDFWRHNNKNDGLLFLQENYDRMQVLVDELKARTEKIKLGRCEHKTVPCPSILKNIADS